jgi:integrase
MTMRRKLSASEIKKRLRAGAYHDGAKPLSAKRVQRLKGEGRYHDADVRGLYLQISASGARSWLLRYELLDKERMMGLGSAQEFSLAQARDRAREARRQLADGTDPLQAKRAAKAASKLAAARRLTFREAAQRYYRQHMPEWRSVAHAKQWQRSLEVYAYPVLGEMDVGEIITADILRVLESDWLDKTVTLDRVRNRIESIIDSAVVLGHRQAGTNPARWRGHLSEVLASVKKIAEPQHHAALPYVEVPAFMQTLRRQQGLAAQALEFAILSAARSGEVLGAKWHEIDIANRVWVIPAERMKAGKKHTVPLAPQAIELLRALSHEEGNEFVFIGAKAGAGLSAMALFRVLQRMGHDDVTVHGFRSCFSDWAHEATAHASHTIEISLAHSVGNEAEKAYRRGPMLAKRKQLMEAWGKYCVSKPVLAKSDNVVTLRGAR